MFERVCAVRVDFSRVRFHSFYAQDCRFLGCDFSEVVADGLPFASGGSTFVDCRFERARIADFGDVRMERCQFIDADLNGWFAQRADIVDCRFSGRLEKVVFFGRDSHGNRNEFRGNDFRNAELIDVGFRRGIDLRAQALPDGPEYLRLDRVERRRRKARRQVSRWRDEGERRLALAIIDGIAVPHHGQREILIRRDMFDDLYDPDLARRVLEIVEAA